VQPASAIANINVRVQRVMNMLAECRNRELV
jgi:hypothetical protein